MPDGLIRTPSRMLLTTDAVGGVWRYTLDLARGMGTPPVIAVLGPPPSTAQREEAAGLRLIETGLPLDWTADSPADLAGTVTQLRRLAEREAASSVHLHAPALAGAQRWSMPLIAVAHSCVATWWAAVRTGPLPDDLAWRAEATRIGLDVADAVVAPTAAHAAATQKAYGDRAITVIHNGTSLLEPSPARGRGQGEGGATSRNSILTAGRLWDDAKNAIALDQAAPNLDAPIHAAGPLTGPNGAQAHLPNLHLLGTLTPEAMRRAYAEAPVFASLARYEPFGLSVLEAARSGCRLVLSDIPSFRELWDGVARFVPLDTDPTPALRAALADTGDHGATERAGRYTLDRMVEGTLQLHRRVMASAS